MSTYTACPVCGGVELPAASTWYATEGAGVCRCGRAGSSPSKCRDVKPFTSAGGPRQDSGRTQQGYRTEAQLVSAIQRALECRGWQTLRIGQYRADMAGQSAGAPDLLARNSTMAPACWIGIEVKLPRGRLSERQAELEAAGAIRVCRSVEDALAAVGEEEDAR